MRDVDVIADPASAAAALDPVRARLLAELREPASASTLASRLGVPRQRINYHLLEKHGLVEVAGTRTWGGLTERQLVATAAGYVVSPEALAAAASAPRPSADRMSAAYVLALAARVVAEVGGMARNAVRQRKTAASLRVGHRDPVRLAGRPCRVRQELTAAVNRLVSKYHDERTPSGRWQRLMVAIHPVLKGVDPGTPNEQERS